MTKELVIIQYPDDMPNTKLQLMLESSGKIGDQTDVVFMFLPDYMKIIRGINIDEKKAKKIKQLFKEVFDAKSE